MLDFEVTIARADEREIIANMMQFYIHDFSEHWSGLAIGELQPHGRFFDYPLDPYWRERDHIPLIVRRENHPIGFALLNATAHSGHPVDRNVAEFFIVRKHRRNGMGGAIAHTIFSRYPGQWEAAVARRNVAAHDFWRRTIAKHPGVSEIEERDTKTAEWNGPIIRFRIAAA